MKATLALLLLSALVAAAEEKFTTRYDNVDLDEILKNDRLFDKYAQCLLEDSEAHCTADGKELKKAVPDALSNECAKCNEKQKAGTEKVLKFLISQKKETWEKLKAKYDPDGKYGKKYEDKVKGLQE